MLWLILHDTLDQRAWLRSIQDSLRCMPCAAAAAAATAAAATAAAALWHDIAYAVPYTPPNIFLLAQLALHSAPVAWSHRLRAQQHHSVGLSSCTHPCHTPQCSHHPVAGRCQPSKHGDCHQCCGKEQRLAPAPGVTEEPKQARAQERANEHQLQSCAASTHNARIDHCSVQCAFVASYLSWLQKQQNSHHM
jgi:hypothetical protein